MKINKFLPLIFLFILVSCNKKEMKISRTDKTIVSELMEQSPIYITKAKDGSALLNEKNRIGNTDWVFSISNDLPMESILVDLQRLIVKKYTKGMHPDSKKVYLLYLDTLNKQPAYLPIDHLDFISGKPKTKTDLSFDKSISVEYFIQEMVKKTTKDTVVAKTPIYFY